MNWLIALDVLLWIAAAVLLITSWVTLSSYWLFIWGLICLILALVLLCILLGNGNGLSDAGDFISDIFD